MASVTPPDLAAIPCPDCGEKTLGIQYRLEPLPTGSYSLAGVQDKFAAREWPWLVCSNCGRSSRGEIA